MMKVLITGACGFVGRELIRELEDHGHDLVLLDRQLPQEATVFVPGSKERAVSPLEVNWPFLQVDIMDAAAVIKALEGVDAVIHLAAIPTGFPENGIETFTFNALGTFILLDACRQNQVKRFICSSSINAFGTFYWRLSGKAVEYCSLPLSEDFKPVPEDPYSLSKWVNEETCASFTRAYGIHTAALRFGGIWSHQMYETTMAAGLKPTEKWSNDLWTWVHIQDIVKGIRQALEHEALPAFGVYTLNAADTRCPEPSMELITKLRPEYADILTHPLEGRASLLSIDRAKNTFGYNPEFYLQ
jgi:UDP-glucose 4-epimerase